MQQIAVDRFGQPVIVRRYCLEILPGDLEQLRWRRGDDGSRNRFRVDQGILPEAIAGSQRMKVDIPGQSHTNLFTNKYLGK